MSVVLFALGTWLCLLVYAVHAARDPAGFVAARRAFLSDAPVSFGDMKIVRALVAMAVSVGLFAAYAADSPRFGCVVVGASVVLWLVCEVLVRRGESGVKTYAVMRLQGVVAVGMAIWAFNTDDRVGGVVILAVGLTMIVFPRAWSKLMLRRSEEQEVRTTRWTAKMAAFAAALMTCALLWILLRYYIIA